MHNSSDEFVYIEHWYFPPSINCENHGYHTRHRSEVYQKHHELIRESILHDCPDLKILENVVPPELENRFYSPDDPRWRGIKPVGRYRFPRVGAFEVVFKGRIVFSKLDCGFWPNNRLIARKIRDLYDGVEPDDQLTPDHRPATRSLSTRQGKRSDPNLLSHRSGDAFPMPDFPPPPGSFVTEEIPVELHLNTKGNHEIPQTNDTDRPQKVLLKCEDTHLLQVPLQPFTIHPGGTVSIPLVFTESPVETVKKCTAYLYIDGKVAECLKFTVFYKEYINPANRVIEGNSSFTIPLNQKLKKHISYVNHSDAEQHIRFDSSDTHYLKVKKHEVTVLPGEAVRADVKFKKVKEPGTRKLVLTVRVDERQGPVYEFDVTYGN